RVILPLISIFFSACHTSPFTSLTLNCTYLVTRFMTPREARYINTPISKPSPISPIAKNTSNIIKLAGKMTRLTNTNKGDRINETLVTQPQTNIPNNTTNEPNTMITLNSTKPIVIQTTLAILLDVTGASFSIW